MILSGSGARVYRIDGGFTIDIPRRVVRNADSEIHLRPKTFTVLAVLIDNRERTISKDELLAAVWEDTAVTDDVLVTSITEIRRAFGDDPRASRFIKTVHGTGYRWIAPIVEAPAAAGNERDTTESSKGLRVLTPAAFGAGLLVLLAAGVLWPRIGPEVVEHDSESAWWKLDETSGDAVVDSSGHENSGRILSGVQRVTGRLGGALRFDGLGDGVAGRTGSWIPIGNAARTVALWLKTNSTNGDFTNLLHYGVNGEHPPAANFVVALTPDGRVEAGNGFNLGFIRGQSRIADGAWHSVAVAYEGPQSHLARIYIDGSEDASGRLNPQPATINGGTWTMGKFLGGGTRFRGELDDVRVFDRVLRPAEVQALFRCSAGIVDLASADHGGFYYLPVMNVVPRTDRGEIVNAGKDIGGIQLARSDGTCAVTSLKGTSIGQDLYLSADLKTPGGANGLVTEAAIYFRSRKAHAGDGIIGGTSGGYWVRLRTGGQVSVMCLNPGRTIAFQNVPGIASDEYHRLEVVAVGAMLQASLDGKLIEFDQGGHLTSTVSIPSYWDGPPKTGNDEGTVGVVFTADMNRGQLSGQAARNFAVRPATKLLAAR